MKQIYIRVKFYLMPWLFLTYLAACENKTTVLEESRTEAKASEEIQNPQPKLDPLAETLSPPAENVTAPAAEEQKSSKNAEAINEGAELGFLADFSLAQPHTYLPLQIEIGQQVLELPKSYKERQISYTLLANPYLELKEGYQLRIKSKLPPLAKLVATLNIESSKSGETESEIKPMQLEFTVYKLKAAFHPENAIINQQVKLQLDLVDPLTNTPILNQTGKVGFATTYFNEGFADGELNSGSMIASQTFTQLGQGEVTFTLNNLQLHESIQLNVLEDPSIAGPFDHYEVRFPSNELEYCGYHDFTVTAKDHKGLTVTDHIGDIHFVSNQISMNLPLTSSMNAEDRGVKSFSGSSSLFVSSLADFTFSAQAAAIAATNASHTDHALSFTVSTGSIKGLGSQADPFLICNEQQWNSNHLANSLGLIDKHFKLMQDITGVTPVNQVFSGSLDGNGYAIKDMAISPASETDEIALFRETVGAEFKNLKLENLSFTSAGSRSGILIGTAFDTRIKNLSGDLLSIQAAKNNSEFVGGLIGLAYNSSLEDIKLTRINITLQEDRSISKVGGMVGQLRGGHIDRSEISGELTALKPQGYIFGGIVGSAISSTISNSLGKTNITTSPYTSNSSPDGGLSRIGGLIGEALSLTTIYAAGYNGDIEITNQGTTLKDEAFHRIGGLIGHAEDLIQIYDAYSKGTMNLGWSAQEGFITAVGSLVGFTDRYLLNMPLTAIANLTINRAYSTMNISITRALDDTAFMNSLMVGFAADDFEIYNSIFAGQMTYTPAPAGPSINCISWLASASINQSDNARADTQACTATHGDLPTHEMANLKSGAGGPILNFDIWDDPKDATNDLGVNDDFDIWMQTPSAFPKLWFEDLNTNNNLATHFLSQENRDGLSADKAFLFDPQSMPLTLLANPRFANRFVKFSTENISSITLEKPFFGDDYDGNPFLGFIDFNGFTLNEGASSNLNSKNGIFKSLPAGLTLQNLTIGTVQLVSAGELVGILAGYAASDFDAITINATSSIESSGFVLGALAGVLFGGNGLANGDFNKPWFTSTHADLKNISIQASAAHTDGGEFLGGFAAYCDGITIADSLMSGHVTIQKTPAGGICGLAGVTSDIRIERTQFNPAPKNPPTIAEGVVEHNATDPNYFGGIVGVNTMPPHSTSVYLSHVSTTGDFNLPNTDYIGGIMAGALRGWVQIENARNEANILGEDGVAGILAFCSDAQTNIINSQSHANIYGQSNTGLIIGEDVSGNITESNNNSSGNHGPPP